MRADPSRVRKGVKLCWDLTVAVAPLVAAASLVLTIVSFVLSPLFALFIARLTDAATAHHARQAAYWGIALGVSLPLSWYLRRTGFLLGHPMMHPSTRKGEQTIIAAIASLPGLEHLERPEYLDRLTVLRQERTILLGIQSTLISAIGAIVQMVVTVGLLATISPWMVLVVLCAVPQLWFARRSAAIRRRTAEANASNVRLSTHLLALLSKPAPGRELRVLGAVDEVLGRDRALSTTLIRTDISGFMRSQALAAAGSLLVAFASLAAVGFTLIQLVYGHGSVGNVMMTIVLTQQVTGSLNYVVGTTSQILEAIRVTGRYLWFMDYVEANQKPRVSGARKPTPPSIANGISLESVSFRYAGRSEPALVDITTHLPAGSTVALVGENGAGKTTLVKLLSRMYEPTSGRISVDGVPIDDFDVEEWRANMTAAFQDFGRFEFLVRETVGVGALSDDGAEHVERAIEEAGAHKFVTALPAGIETQLGLSWPNGVDISGGQWQALAIARSGMRPTPLLVLLDEPTSALDPFAEASVFDRYRSAARRSATERGGIAVLVSHRYSTVRAADLILVMEGGRVIEQGSHEELMDLAGWYAESFTTQAKGYR